MSIETMERELADLRRRMEKVEAKVQHPAGQRWRAAAGSIKANDLTHQAAQLGAEWRAEENKRS